MLAGLAIVLLGAAVWMAWSGWQAAQELTAAKGQLATVRDSLVDGDPDTMASDVREISAETARARSLTSGPVWRAVGAVPWVGGTASAVTAAAATTDRLGQEVLPGLVDLRHALDPQELRPAGDQLDIAALEAAAPQLEALARNTAEVAVEAAALQTDGLPPALADAVDTLASQTESLASTLERGAQAARLLPPMLGGEGPRRYLLVIQNNAESRGTGGLVGAFAVLAADHGRIRVERLASNAELRPLSAPALDLGPDFTALYGADPAFWGNVTLTPDFPSAAALMREMWRRQTGERLDGVLATDPVALSYLLRATGPVTLPSGEQVTADNAVALAMHDIYARWPRVSQDPQRNAFSVGVGRAVVEQVLAGAGDPRALARELGRAAAERRLLVWSAVPSEASELASTAVGGAIDARPGPYAALVVNNGAGNKLDYYLDRRLDYALAECPAGSGGLRGSTIRVTVRNGAPASGLPEYAAMRLDRGEITGDPLATAAAKAGGDGSTRLRLQVYAATGAELVGATLDGHPVSVTPGRERGRPVFVLPIELASGASGVLELRLVEPASDASPRVWVQPLVRTPVTTVNGATCR